MRVALLLIAVAIYDLSLAVSPAPEERKEEEKMVSKFYALMFVVFAVMDLIDFIG